MSVLETLHVEIRGTGNPLLLFVPGWGCDRTVWSRLTPLLEEAFRVAVFDPRSFGEGEKALTEASGWDEEVDVHGESPFVGERRGGDRSG
jgi:pimeloyl-ACP methyl ester carboxylesterase